MRRAQELFFFQAEDGIRDVAVTGVQTCALPILLDTLKRMSILSSDRSTNAVKFELQKDMLRVTSQNPDLGDAKEEIPVAYGGTPMQIGFNARYLMDVLSVVEAPQVNVEL